MQKEVKVAAFDGGELRLLPSEAAGHEVVLALSLDRLIVKMVRVPAENDPVEFATPILQAMSPYPDEPLDVSCELVREEGEAKVVLATALPESSAEDIGEALDRDKLNVCRIDMLMLGRLRALWSALNADDDRRRLVMMREGGYIGLLVLDGATPSAIRSVSMGTEAAGAETGPSNASASMDLRRELMLSLLEAEDFGGAKELAEIVYVGEGEAPAHGLDVPTRVLADPGEEAALRGVEERSLEAGSLDALPSSWREVLMEERFKSKLIRNLAIAGGIWLLIMGVLFGVPFGYGYLSDRQKAQTRRNHAKYQEVANKEAKVMIVGKYSDHSRSALELMKAVNDILPPEGITLNSWGFKREDGEKMSIRFSGEADQATLVYNFKNALDKLSFETSEDGEETDEEAERVFKTVRLNGPSAIKGGKQRFDIELNTAAEVEE